MTNCATAERRNARDSVKTCVSRALCLTVEHLDEDLHPTRIERESALRSDPVCECELALRE